MFTRVQAWELSLLALCVWREARGEPYNGMLGVAWSIRNRVLDPKNNWWGNDWEEVVLKPWQYSSFNSNDPNAVKFPGDPKKDPSWSTCLQVAEEVYSNTVADPTGGATHYHTTAVSPLWAKTAQFKIKLGNQLFYVAS